MAFTIQLRDARASLALKSISGVCSSDDEFLALLNEAMRRLLRRGGWWNTEFLMRLCVYNKCITWPRIVGTVLGTRFCNGSFDLRNNWWNIVGPFGCNNAGPDTFRSSFTISDNGTAPIYNDLTGTSGKYIRIYPTKIQDQGKTITLFGLTTGSQPLQQLVDGRWERGLTLTLQAPYVQSTVLVRRIDSVVKEITEANVLMYEVDPTDATLVRDIALYEPTET